MQKLPLLTLLAFAASSLPPKAAGAKPVDLAREYEQVRTIAQRDPKVRKAYQDADDRLAAKIVEIDPALKGYVPGKPAPAPAAAKPAPAPAAKPAPAKPAPPAPKPVVAKPAPQPKPAPAPQGLKHTVANGETLGGIANRYGVAVASVKSANHIKDERKLAVGQVLVIPGGKKPAASSSPSASNSHAAKPKAQQSTDDGFWSRIKKSL